MVFRWLLVPIAIAAIGILVVGFSFPFLASNAPSGARVAVVEGWIGKEHLPAIKDILDHGGYDTIYITGTPRNFSYTLRLGDTVEVDLQDPVHGELLVNACGAKDAWLNVSSDQGIVLTDRINGPCTDRKAQINRPTKHLRFTPTHDGRPDPRWELLYINYAKVNGNDLHAIHGRTTIIRADGTREPGMPSFADAMAHDLKTAGINAERIHQLPTTLVSESRTWANAKRFAQEARLQKIERVDVISFGIHARRSRLTFARACGSAITVGVRCVEDPELQRGRWWHHALGWYKVLRELAGVPASYFVDPVK